MVKAARQEEIEYIRKMNLYTKVPISDCLKSFSSDSTITDQLQPGKTTLGPYDEGEDKAPEEERQRRQRWTVGQRR